MLDRHHWTNIEVRLVAGSLTGQISASLAAMHRTVEDYDSMAKREIIKAKQEKAMMYVFLHHRRETWDARINMGRTRAAVGMKQQGSYYSSTGAYRSSVQIMPTCEHNSSVSRQR